jgi:DNA-binding MarR family transcriptional regulator
MTANVLVMALEQIDLSAEPLQAPIRRLFLLVARELRTVLDRDLARFGLRAQQAAVLLRCARLPGAKPTQLAAAVGTDTAGITGIIDQLEKKGLVERRTDPLDRRAVQIEPTAAGRELIAPLRDVFLSANEILLAGFSSSEITAFAGLLTRLRSNLGARLGSVGAPRLPHPRSTARDRGPLGVPPPGDLHE